MSRDEQEGRRERRDPQRRGRVKRVQDMPSGPTPAGRPEAANGHVRERPDFTRAETYMTEHAPTVSDILRTDVDIVRHDVIRDQKTKRRLALRIAAVFLLAGLGMIGLSDLYGPVVDGIAGAIAAFGIAVTIHVLNPRPVLRFMLVVIALACLAVTFAVVLNIHLHGLA